MDAVKTNLKLRSILSNWDPFHVGVGNYETEIVDVIQAVYLLDDPKVLASKIQAIYEFSYEQIIPLKQCEKMAKELLTVKNEAACNL